MRAQAEPSARDRGASLIYRLFKLIKLTPWLERWLPIVALTALTLYAYLPYSVAAFAGTDALTSIDTSRVASWSDFVEHWTQPFMTGTSFPSTSALIYRPLVGLTFAADYALWGLNSTGYFATNVLLHLATGLLLYWFLRCLRLSRWAAFLGASTLLFHPGMVAAVPVISRRHDSFAAAALFASMALLCLGLEAKGRRRRALEAGSLLLFAAALLGKESAFGAVPLVPLVLFAAWSVQGDTARHRLSDYARVLVPYFLVAAAVFAMRNAVLGGLGGYLNAPLGTFDPLAYRVHVNRYVLYLMWPFRDIYATSDKGWLLVAAATLLAGLGVLWALPRRYRVLVAVGGLWIVGFGAFFVGLKTLAGPWYLYYPLAGVGLIVASATEVAVGIVRQGRTRWARLRSGQTLRGAGRLLLFGAATAYVVAALALSPLVKYYPEWGYAGEISDYYIDYAVKCTVDVPENATVIFGDVPDELRLGTPESELLVMTLVGDFTLESALRLAHGRSIRVNALSYIMVSSARTPEIKCQGDSLHREVGASWG